MSRAKMPPFAGSATAEEAPKSRKRAANPNRGSKPGERRGGRRPGTPNKVTADVREAIKQLVEEAAPHMGDWLERVAKDDPARALDIALKAAEYAIPKLSRAEVRSYGSGLTLEALIEGSMRADAPPPPVVAVDRAATKPAAATGTGAPASPDPDQTEPAPPKPQPEPEPEPPRLNLREETVADYAVYGVDRTGDADSYRPF